jgi:hypothetical protein
MKGSYVMLLPQRKGNILLPLEVAQKLQDLPVHDEHGQKVGFIQEVRKGQNEGYWEAVVKVTSPAFMDRVGFSVADLSPIFDMQSTKYDLMIEEVALVSKYDQLDEATKEGDQNSIKVLENEIKSHERKQKRLQQKQQQIKSSPMFKGGIIKMAEGKSVMYLSQKTLRSVTERPTNPLAASLFSECCAEVVKLLGTAAVVASNEDDLTILKPSHVARGLQMVLPKNVANEIIRDVFKGKVPDALIETLTREQPLTVKPAQRSE